MKLLVKLFSIVWTKAMDQKLSVSGCIFTTSNKGQLSGKICQSSYLSMCEKKKIKSVLPAVIALCGDNLDHSLTSQSTYLHFLCFAWEALGEITLISLQFNLLTPCFPESSIFFPSLSSCTDKKERKRKMKTSAESGKSGVSVT